jgi:antibiotic biosynthesis monooxygenase (ABM) superfamily enzyme
MVVTLDIEPAWEAEFNRWHVEEHVPLLLSLPGFVAAERWQALRGEPKYMAWYQLDSLDAYDKSAKGTLGMRPEHAAVVNTEWAARVREHRKVEVAFYQQLTSTDGFAYGPAWDGGRTKSAANITFRTSIPPEHEAEFNRWYLEEHFPNLTAIPGVLMGRRFKAIQGEPQYMARYDYVDASVPDSDVWLAAAETPWTHAIRKKHVDRRLVLYERIDA